TAEAEGWLDSNGLSARATGSGEPDERDDSSVSVFFHPAGDSRLVEQLRRLAQRQTDHGRIAAAQLGDEHRAPTLDCIATGLVTRLATGPVGLGFGPLDPAETHPAGNQAHLASTPGSQRNGGQHVVFAVREGFEHQQPFGPVSRLAEYSLIDD